MFGYVQETEVNMVKRQYWRRWSGKMGPWLQDLKLSYVALPWIFVNHATNVLLHSLLRTQNGLKVKDEKFLDKECMELLWSKGTVLPTSFIDILDCVDIVAKVKNIEKINVDWDGTSNDENDGYE